MDRELMPVIDIAAWESGHLWPGVAWPFCVVVLIFLPGWLRPFERERIRTARVDRGPVEGSWRLRDPSPPAFEAALSSPVEERVEKILKRPGETVVDFLLLPLDI